jgi:hypothetical protein
LLRTSVPIRREKATRNWQTAGHWALVLGFCHFAAGCAYRFTNEHMSTPPGVHTLAVEAIYDTSREVLPHELLWESLQQAFATDGHLKLAPQSSADALLRAHIKQAVVTTTGPISINPNDSLGNSEIILDPKTFSKGDPPLPDQFKNMTQASEYQTQAATNVVVEVEVWNLNTRALILRKTYPAGRAFLAERAAAGVDPVKSYQVLYNNDYLRYDEAERANFKQISAAIASSVVTDLLVK